MATTLLVELLVRQAHLSQDYTSWILEYSNCVHQLIYLKSLSQLTKSVHNGDSPHICYTKVSVTVVVMMVHPEFSQHYIWTIHLCNYTTPVQLQWLHVKYPTVCYKPFNCYCFFHSHQQQLIIGNQTFRLP